MHGINSLTLRNLKMRTLYFTNCLFGFVKTGFKAKSKWKFACIDARGSDSKVHSIAMSMWASTSRKGGGESAKAT